MNWIKCSDQLPDKPMQLLVLIGDKIFKGESYFGNERAIRINDSEKFILFEMKATTRVPGLDLYIESYENKWHVPSHFKEPSHWMPLEFPNAMD